MRALQNHHQRPHSFNGAMTPFGFPPMPNMHQMVPGGMGPGGMGPGGMGPGGMGHGGMGPNGMGTSFCSSSVSIE